MKLALEQYQLILESAPNMVWRSGLDAKCDYFNKTWLNFRGRTAEQELGDGWAEGVHKEDHDRCVSTYLQAFKKREPFEMHYRLKRFDGVYRVINDRGVPFYLTDGRFAGYIGSCIDVTEKVEGQILWEMAIKDGLTGIYNRQFFLRLLENEMEFSCVNDQPLSLMMIDVDKFKNVNDRYGHLFGDLMLQKVAEIISGSVREKDIVGRFGGDEFVVLLPHTSIEYAEHIADRICANVSQMEVEQSGNKFGLTLSVGLADFHDAKDAMNIIEKADRAMYYSKSQGGNSISLAANI